MYTNLLLVYKCKESDLITPSVGLFGTAKKVPLVLFVFCNYISGYFSGTGSTVLHQEFLHCYITYRWEMDVNFTSRNQLLQSGIEVGKSHNKHTQIANA